MEDSLQVVCEWFVDSEGIAEGGISFAVTSMNDDILSRFYCECEVLSEKVSLPLMVAFLGPTCWSRVKVIETGLSDCGDTMMSGEFLKGFEIVIGGLVYVTRMNPDTRVDLRKFFCNRQVAGNILQVGREGHHSGDSGVTRTVDERAKFVL